MRAFRVAVAAALILGSGQAVAQDVTLTSRDGSVEVSGTLLGYDGEFYRVDTVYGPLTIDGAGVTCEGPGCPDLEAFVARLTISGAARMGEVLMPALIESFAGRRNLLVRRIVETPRRSRFELSERGSGRIVMEIAFGVSNSAEGFADLVADEADIAMSLREIRDDELALARDAGLGDLGASGRSQIVALDALVPLAASRNHVGEIDLDDLVRIVAGEIRNWQDLGGPDEEIAVHLPDPGSGLFQSFRDKYLDPRELRPRADAEYHLSLEALADAVMADPFALGLGTVSETGNAESLPITGDCGFLLQATPLGLKSEDYPLTAPLFLYFSARRLPPLARALLDDLASPAASAVIRRAGFVDLRIAEVGMDMQGLRLANAVTAAGTDTGLSDLKRVVERLAGARRLSLSFRFDGGEAQLDAQSRANVRLLARAIESGAYDGRRLIFAGFSDGEGPAAPNLALARSRAVTVRDAVEGAAEFRPRGGPDMEVTAFGEAMPLACDTAEWGRRINRRVEVWVE